MTNYEFGEIVLVNLGFKCSNISVFLLYGEQEEMSGKIIVALTRFNTTAAIFDAAAFLHV